MVRRLKVGGRHARSAGVMTGPAHGKRVFTVLTDVRCPTCSYVMYYVPVCDGARDEYVQLMCGNGYCQDFNVRYELPCVALRVTGVRGILARAREGSYGSVRTKQRLR